MKSRDPKEVIRGGLIDARQASQFFTPRGEDKAKKYRMRVLNAVGDLLRTLGYRFNPYYVKPPDLPLPAEMDLIVFWLIQLNARRRNEQKVLLPVVGDAPAGATHLRVWIPTDSGNAELYPTLREGIVAANQYGDYFRQPAATISFFRDAMRKRQSNRPALLLLADQNLRRVFPELGDPQGDGDISLYEILDPKSPVRVARLRFSVDDEAPFCVPGDVKGKYQGLYGHADFPTVFYSLHNLGERHQSGNWRKLNSPEKAAANPSTVQIWMNNLQPDDEPAAWAGLVHRLRLESSHTDIPTRYPQPLHDLQIIPQYLSRLVDDQEEEDLNAVDETIEQG